MTIVSPLGYITGVGVVASIAAAPEAWDTNNAKNMLIW
jgi:hypothetical protein